MLKNKFKYRKQINMKDCGVAALATVLDNYGTYHSLVELRNLAKTTDEGTTILGLSIAAEKLGMDTKAIKADKTLFEIDNLKFPFIVHVIKNEKFLHYYVVFKITKKYIIIADPDPSIGIKKMEKKRFFKEWTGAALFLTPSNNFSRNQKKNSNFYLIASLIKEQRKIIFLISLAAVVITLITVLSSLFFKVVIDTIIPAQLLNTLTIISLGLIFAQILQKILEYGRIFLLQILGQRFSIKITLGYINRLFRVPITYFYTRNIGDIVSRFRDASAIIDALASIFVSSILDIFIIVILSIVLYFQVPQLFGVLLLSIPVFIIIIICFFKPFSKKNREVLESNATLSTSVIDDLYGIETIKSLNKEKNRYEKIDREFVTFLKKDFVYANLNNLQTNLKQGLQLIISTIILWMGSSMVMNNDITLGELVTFNTLLSYFFSPLENIINLQPKLQEGKIAYDRIKDIFEEKIETDDSKKQNLTPGDIILKNISYSYGYGKEVLKNINLVVNNNSIITITGESGSGKSTLAKMLVGFYEPTNGDIYISNTNIKDVNTKKLRNHVTYLPQQPYIFTGTILENLLLANDNINMKEISKIIEFVGLTNDIENMPLGYNTRISSDGSGLSGGQKQRLALARALLKDFNVLILDEATSNLDLSTESYILDNLTSLKNKTIIFISHGQASAIKSDKVFVMKEGEIIDSGTFNELKNRGYYNKL